MDVSQRIASVSDNRSILHFGLSAVVDLALIVLPVFEGERQVHAAETSAGSQFSIALPLEELNRFLSDPPGVLPGTSMALLLGLSRDEHIALIAYRSGL